MNRIFLVLGILTACTLLIPSVAEAQRGGRGGGGFGGGGGGFRAGGGNFGGGGFRGGNPGGMGGQRMLVPPGGMSGGGFRGQAIAARPVGPPRVNPGAGGFRQAAINNPAGRFDNRIGNRGNWQGVRPPPGSYRGRYPNYGGRYPYYGGRYPYYRGNYPYYGNYYGGWGLGAGLVTGSLIGAAATYPYYNYPYGYPYGAYQTPAASALGGYCATSVRVCALTRSAPMGTGCSCRVSGGRARGTVVAGN